MIDETETPSAPEESTSTNDVQSEEGKKEKVASNELEAELQAIKAQSDSTESEEEKISPVKDLEAVYDIPVQISAVLGRSTMPVHQLLKLGRGAVVELDRRVGEAIDIYVNNRLIARGEVVVVDEHLGVTMTEIIKSDRS